MFCLIFFISCWLFKHLVHRFSLNSQYCFMRLSCAHVAVTFSGKLTQIFFFSFSKLFFEAVVLWVRKQL
jgi:hypothetical protein